MNEQTVTISPYKGYRISINRDFTFRGDPMEDNDDERILHAASMEALHTAIDKAITERTNASRENFRIPVVLEDGERMTAKGFHLRDGDFLFHEGRKEHVSRVYPDTPEVTAAISERNTLQKRIEKLNKLLRSLELRCRGSYNMAQHYTTRVQQFKEDIAEATARAKTLDWTTTGD